jgi:hypothetical protein
VTNYTYDNPLTTANVTHVQQMDSVQGSIDSYISYLANGNIQTQQD